MKFLRINTTFEYLKSFVVLVLVTSVLSRELLPTNKFWYGFQQDTRSDRSSKFTGSHDQDPIDLYQEYKDSIYVSRSYNASFVCQIPIFTLTLPQRNSNGNVSPNNLGLNIGFPIIQSFFILAGIALFAPLIFPEERRRSFTNGLNFQTINQFLENQMNLISESAIGRSLRTEERHTLFYFVENNFKAIFESVLNSIDNSLDYLPYFAKNKLQNCFQWSVCELYNRPKKYGLIGILFRAMFPNTDSQSTSGSTNYRLAAVYGRQPNNDCRQRYTGCSISKWDVIKEIVFFLFSRNEHKVSKNQKNVILYAFDKISSYLLQ